MITAPHTGIPLSHLQSWREDRFVSVGSQRGPKTAKLDQIAKSRLFDLCFENLTARSNLSLVVSTVGGGANSGYGITSLVVFSQRHHWNAVVSRFCDIDRCRLFAYLLLFGSRIQ